MKIATCHFKSNSAYSQSKFIEVPKKPKESSADYEDRTWRERVHTDDNGFIIIPPMALVNCVKEAAKYLSIPIPGEGKSRYTKHFESGIIPGTDIITMPIKKSDVIKESLFVPSNGERGGGKRVLKHFPLITEWEGQFTFYILDDKITQDVFEQVVDAAGQLIGIGRFRPRNWGYYGRFELAHLEWQEDG